MCRNDRSIAAEGVHSYELSLQLCKKAPVEKVHPSTVVSLALEEDMVEVRIAKSLDALEEHAEAWDRLAMASFERLPQLSHAWVSSFLEHCSGGAPWHCLFAYQGTELVGVLPLIHVPGLFVSPASWKRDLHTQVAHPLLASGAAPTALVTLVEAAFKLAPRLRMRWYRVRVGSPVLASLPVLESRMRVIRPLSGRGSLVRTTGRYQDFEATLHRNFRRNTGKAARRAARDHSMAFQFFDGDEAQNSEHLQRFLRVEDSGWKGAAGTSIARSPDLVAFYQTLTQRLAKNGWLEWHTLELDGELAACHLAVRMGGAVALPKIAYDEGYARYGPGNLLFRELLVRSFDDPTVEEVNCMTDMRWHKNWAMPVVGYADVSVSSRGGLPTLASMLAMSKPSILAYAHSHPQLMRQYRRAHRVRLKTGRRFALVRLANQRVVGGQRWVQ